MKKNLRVFTLVFDDGKGPTFRIYPIIELFSKISLGLTKVGLDIETTPKYPHKGALDPWKGEIRLVGLYDGEHHYCLDLRNPEDLAAFHILLSLLVKHNIWVVAHNAWFEATWILFHFKIHLRWRCSFIAHRLLFAGERRSASLENAAVDCGLPRPDKTLQLSSFAGDIHPKQRQYVCEDAEYAYRCEEELYNRYIQWGPIYTIELEYEVIQPFAEMGVMGVGVDEEELKRQIEQLKFANLLCDAKLGFDAGKKQNLIRLAKDRGFKPQDLLLLDVLNSSEIEDKDLGEPVPNFGDDVLITFERKDPSGPWKDIRRKRKLQWFQGYDEGIEARIFEGRVRARYTTTAQSGYGRVSISEPNLANSGKLPKLLKEIGLSPTRLIFKDPEMCSTDLPAAHARVAAFLSRCLPLKTAIDKGDIHSMTASIMAAMEGINWSFEEIMKWRKDKEHPNYERANKLRDPAKEVFYSWLNGTGKVKLKNTLATGEANMNISLDQSSDYLSAANNTYPSLKALKDMLSGKKVNKFKIPEYRWLEQVAFRDEVHTIKRYIKGASLTPTGRMMCAWMGGEATWAKDILRHAWRDRAETGFQPLFYQHDETVWRKNGGRLSTRLESVRRMEELCLDISNQLVGFTRFYKDGEPDCPDVNKKGEREGSFCKAKMMINNLSEKA